MARRRYSDEYKREAVELTRAPGKTDQQVAQNLDINAHMLGEWRKAIENHGKDALYLPSFKSNC